MAKRVLVVDDEILIRWFIEKAVANWGYQVVTAGSSDEALDHLKSNNFDILITDIIMPGTSGVELISEVRKLGKNIGIVACSAFFTTDLVEDFHANGVYTLKKPFGQRELRESLEKISMNHDLSS